MKNVKSCILACDTRGWSARATAKVVSLFLLCLIFLGSPSVYAEAEMVDINTADAETLEMEIVGVGPKLAQAIVDYRDEYGPFPSVDDLMRVSGVGSVLVERNRDKLSAEAPPSMEKQKSDS